MHEPPSSPDPSNPCLKKSDKICAPKYMVQGSYGVKEGKAAQDGVCGCGCGCGGYLEAEAVDAAPLVDDVLVEGSVLHKGRMEGTGVSG